MPSMKERVEQHPLWVVLSSIAAGAVAGFLFARVHVESDLKELERYRALGGSPEQLKGRLDAQAVLQEVKTTVDGTREVASRIERQMVSLETHVVSIVGSRTSQRTSTRDGAAASVAGSGHTTTQVTGGQVGTLAINPKPNLRKDPKEAPAILARIAEGESFVQKLSKCQYEDAELKLLLDGAERWAKNTHDELRHAVSETAAQQFLVKPPPGFRTILAGCNAEAKGTRETVQTFVNNLRRILELLTTE